MDDSDGSPGSSETFAPLRIGGFRALWTASLFSNLGSFFQVTAGSWLMWELTASPAWVGWMTASRNLPLLLLALPAGVLADRFNRATMLAVTQIGMTVVALTMAVLTGTGHITPLLLLLLGICLGVGVSFHAPAWQALVPDLVPRAMVTSAVALNSISFNVARALGPALAGALVAALGAALAFGINAASYVAVAFVVTAIGRGFTAADDDGGSVLKALSAGVRFARHTRAFRRLLVLGTLFALGTAVLQAMLPVRAEELGSSAGGYGILLGMMGAGAAIGGTRVSWFNQRLGNRSIPLTVLLTGIAGILAGRAGSLIMMAASMFVVGIFWLLTLASLTAAVQMMAPDWVRGRAVSIWLFAHAGMVPVGAVLSGLLADRIGGGATMTLLSGLTALLGMGLMLMRIESPATIRAPEFSRVRRGHHHPEEEGGPVLIANTWTIGEHDVTEFIQVMREVKLVRLATGASRWQLFRQAGESTTYTEVYMMSSWDEHLRQHQRIDDESAALIGRARRLDVSSEGPTAFHLLGVDLGSRRMVEVGLADRPAEPPASGEGPQE